jgi:hypothetical protein
MPQVETDVDELRRELDSVISETPEGPKVVTEAGTAEQELDLRPIYSFEEDILDTLISARSGISLTSGRISIKGRWIHGWLDALGEDYISSVWRGYQFFTRYLQVKTTPIQNVATVNRNPGSYESTYRYILVLEDLELIERFATEQAPQSEYDNFVPPNIRQRTFIRNIESYEGNERFWDNPFKQAYPEVEQEKSNETSSTISDEVSQIAPDEPEST